MLGIFEFLCFLFQVVIRGNVFSPLLVCLNFITTCGPKPALTIAVGRDRNEEVNCVIIVCSRRPEIAQTFKFFFVAHGLKSLFDGQISVLPITPLLLSYKFSLVYLEPFSKFTILSIAGHAVRSIFVYSAKVR